MIYEVNQQFRGKAFIDDYVVEGNDFSHLIVGNKVRTLKVIWALAKNCMILDRRYIDESIDKGS